MNPRYDQQAVPYRGNSNSAPMTYPVDVIQGTNEVGPEGVRFAPIMWWQRRWNCDYNNRSKGCHREKCPCPSDNGCFSIIRLQLLRPLSDALAIIP